jgi:hypothetical protein
MQNSRLFVVGSLLAMSLLAANPATAQPVSKPNDAASNNRWQHSVVDQKSALPWLRPGGDFNTERHLAPW